MTAPTTPLTRRSVLAGTCAAGCAALAGCATYSATPASTPAAQPTSAAQPTAAPAPAGSAAPAPAANALVTTAEVPVGSGTILADRQIVVTQPTAGQYKAFSTTCTHQGCEVSSIENGSIVCPCHGSYFSIVDGAPTAGPARRPLPEKAVAVSGDAITLA